MKHNETKLDDVTVKEELETADKSYLETLTEQQLIAIEYLMGGISPSNIAVSLKIGRATLWRWRQRDDFKKAIEAIRKARFDEANVEIDAALIKKAVTADVAAIRLYKQLTGELVEHSKLDLNTDGIRRINMPIKKSQGTPVDGDNGKSNIKE